MSSPVNIAQEVERYRQKLLELSTKNRLLAYRKSPTRTVEIVNEQPDRIFDRLVTSGKSLSFLPAPGVPAAPEDAVLFPELPPGMLGGSLQHGDGSLQTNLAEAKLDGALRTMRADANSAIQETGVNLLHMAFGFLEWYEDKDSERAMLAPLLLVPVRIDKDFDSRTSRWRYAVAYNGEEVQPNRCVQKRMEQDFLVPIPDPEDEQTPEQYFDAVTRIIAHQPRWRVRRETLVGFFSFRKLFMYLDLDPKKWEGEHSMEKNSVLRQIVAGGSVGSDSPTFLGDYEIDGNPQAEAITLATDADSSQHSALCDILAGRDLVIEGPPGTGKSQTITNAIAAALAAGKTVLFVSEKLAALEVVRHTMGKLGLAPFCLELHSEGAKPQRVFSDLADRLSIQSNPPAKVEQKRRQLELAKAQLKEYLDICQVKVGPRDEPIYDVLWRVVEFRTRGVPLLKSAVISADLDPIDFSRRLDVLRELARHVTDIGVPPAHAWSGFNADRVSPENLDEFGERVNGLLAVATALEEKLQQTAKILPVDAKDLINFCLRLDAEQTKRLDLPPNTDGGLLQRLFEQSSRTAAVELAERLERLEVEECIATSFIQKGIVESEPLATEVVRLIKAPIMNHLQHVELQAIQEMSAILENICRLLDESKEYGASLIQLGYESPRTLKELRATGERHQLVMNKAVQSADDLVPDLFTAWTEQYFLDEASKRRRHLLDAHSALASRFEMVDAPPVEQLRSYRLILRKHGGSFLRVFSREYRAARREIRSFLRPGAETTAAALSNHLKELETWLVQKQEFASDRVCSKHFGPLYKGLDSDWPQLEAILRWVKTAKQHGLGYSDAARLVSARDASPGLLDPQELTNFIDTLTKELTDPGIAGAMAGGGSVDDHTPLDELRQGAGLLLETLGRLLVLGRGFNFEPHATLGEVVSLAQTVVDAASTRRTLAATPAYTELCGARSPLECPPAELRSATEWAETVIALGLPGNIPAWASGDPMHRMVLLKASLSDLHTLAAQWLQERAALEIFGSPDAGFLSIGVVPEDPACAHATKRLVAALPQISPWNAFCRALVRAEGLGLGAFCKKIVSGDLSANTIVECFERTFYERLARGLASQHPALRDFSRQRLENARGELQQLDQELLALNRQAIAMTTAGRRPPDGVASGRVAELTEMGLIHREVRKQRGYCKIRDLVSRAGRALQALKPCFMMSPLSVAQFLPPGSLTFDLVLMDEASQIRPEDALGTVVRAKQLVVVGDPKQLPPTAFFDRIADDEVPEDEETLLDGTESILEVAMKAFANVRRLKWHYRSHHESLIAFSNERFYDNDLIVFPSPTRRAGQLGVRCHFVEGGKFVGGCNPVEAERVAQAIVAHAKQYPQETLGVGAFNFAQRDAIQERLDKICGQDAEGRAAVTKLIEASDPLFIKNLENLQGDERDAIFISYTYGPDPATGKVMNRFGPITSQHGWRRLNVLVTRARRRVEVFSSMRPEQILAGPERSRGINSMRDYLVFAQTGLITDGGRPSGREPDSPFEVAVARVIRQLGLDVIPQVGVAGYFIDIGVLRPGSRDEFLLGIECDGAAYHSAKSARDRDRLREEVLKKRGWRLHRIWSTDWYMNQHSEEQRLEKAIKELLKSSSGRLADRNSNKPTEA